jgi:3-hydroxyisobutyrate dehydrogenase
MTTITVLGLGAMGSRMAANLVKAGHHVRVWSRDRSKTMPLVDAGAAAFATPREAAEGATFVLSMVSDDHAARQVWLGGEDGALAGLAPGAVAIECSTVSPAWVRQLGDAAAHHGAALLDAPVSGSRPQAEAGQLVFMVGGDEAILARAATVFQPLAAKTLHVGMLGQGATLKLAVNAFFAAQIASLAEILGVLERAGFARSEAARLLAEFPVVAPPLAALARMMASGDAPPLFTVALIEKDLGYAMDLAGGHGGEAPMTTAARDVFRRAVKRGQGEHHVSAVADLYRGVAHDAAPCG